MRLITMNAEFDLFKKVNRDEEETNKEMSLRLRLLFRRSQGK